MSSAGASQKKRTAVLRKASAETQDHVSCQDMEVDFVPGWHEFLEVKYMCDKQCNVEDDGKPHAINSCRNLYDHRLTASGETKSDQCRLEGYDWTKGVSRQTVCRFQIRWFHQENVGGIHGQKRGGQRICWKR